MIEAKEKKLYETYKLIIDGIDALTNIDLFSAGKHEELLEEIRRWMDAHKTLFLGNDADVPRAQYTRKEIIEILGEVEEFFASCTDFSGMKDIVKKCDECINAIYYLAKNQELWSDGYNAFLIKRILLNSLLIQYCLYPLYKWTEEGNLPLVTKMEYDLNICVIISQTDYFKSLFSRKVRELSKRFNGMDGCNVRVFYLLGLLNFRKNSYKESLYFLKKACDCYKNDPNVINDSHYFQTRILIAYCYEYMHQFDTAINELMGCSVDNFLDSSEAITTIYNIFDQDEYENGVKAVRDFYKKMESDIVSDDATPQGLFHDAILRDQRNNRGDQCGDKHEVLHSFAHCCNELAIKWLKEAKTLAKDEDNLTEKSERLFTVARNTMLYVANSNETDLKECADFSTCLFMIFAEANDFEVCEKQIDNIMSNTDLSEIEDTFYGRSIRAAREKYNEKGDFWAEVNFYKYLVAYFSFKAISEREVGVNRNNEAYKNAVEESFKGYLEYAKCRYDYDAQAYIGIFEYKFKLAQSLRRATDLKSLKEKICDAVGNVAKLRKPSPFVNEWIQYEYEKIVLVGELLNRYVIGAPLEELFALSSRCSRMYAYRGEEDLFNLQEGEMDGDVKLEKCDEGLKYCQRNTNREFILSFNSDTPGDSIILCETEVEARKLGLVLYVLDIIMDDFVSPSSIFILAPLSAAAPYQYQTGNPKVLVDNIFASDNNRYFRGKESEIVEKFRNAGDYDSTIVDKIREVRSSLKMIAFGNRNEGSYFYVDEHWDAPIKRPVINAEGIGKIFNHIYYQDDADEQFVKTSLDEKRHGKECQESGGCRVLLYQYMGDDKISERIKEILKMLFISLQEVKQGDYILLKNGKKDWYIAVIKAGEDARKIWDIISPPLCGIKPVVIGQSLIYTGSEEDFISICYTSKVKDVVIEDAKYLHENGFRIWYDEQINGVTKWTKQVEKRILEPKCHKVIIYISRDLYQDRIPDINNDGLYQEIEFIYKHNQEHSDDEIEYFVVLVGANDNNDIKAFKDDLLWPLYTHDEQRRLETIKNALFGKNHVHAVRFCEPTNVQHFVDVDNKYYITLFSESRQWVGCRKKGE